MFTSRCRKRRRKRFTWRAHRLASTPRYSAPLIDRHLCERVVQRRRHVLRGLLDRDKRKQTEFQFKGQSNAKLFLILASEFWYEAATSKVLRVVHYKLEAEGRVRFDDLDKVTMNHRFNELELDVSGNWEPVPKFGEYQGLMVKERDERYKHIQRT